MTYKDYIEGRWNPRYLMNEIADYFNDDEHPVQYIKCMDAAEQQHVTSMIACITKSVDNEYDFRLGFDPLSFADCEWQYIFHDNHSREIHIAYANKRSPDRATIIDLESLIDNACIRERDAGGKPEIQKDVSVLDIDDLFTALSA